MRRIENEKRVVALMIGIYCRRHHVYEGTACKGGLCPECADLLEYAHVRLDRCPHGERKPSCRKCTIHCYAPMQKEAIRGDALCRAKDAFHPPCGRYTSFA